MLRVAGTPVTTAETGVPYAGFAVSASGGWQPSLFSVVEGALPDGITLDQSTGAVAGTATTAGVSAGIVIEAYDYGGNRARLPAFSITVT